MTAPAPYRERAAGLIRTDVCGPIEGPSIPEAKYLVTFINDYPSSMIEFRTLPKSEVEDCHIHYVVLVESQTGLLIQTDRSDGGCEYLDNEVRNQFSARRIEHQLLQYLPEIKMVVQSN